MEATDSSKLLALIYKTIKPQVHNLETITVMSNSQSTGIISTFAEVDTNVTQTTVDFQVSIFCTNLKKQDVTTLHEQRVPSRCVPKLTYSTRKPAYSKSNIYPLVMSGSPICTKQQIHLNLYNATNPLPLQ